MGKYSPFRAWGVFNHTVVRNFLKVTNTFHTPMTVEVDLGEVTHFHPSGMAPFLALIRHYHDKGYRFEVALPERGDIRRFFERAGGLAAIQGIDPSPVGLGAPLQPLTSYASYQQLNPLVNNTIEHLAMRTVYEAGVLDGIGWSLNEIADNVLNHAGGSAGWLQVNTHPRKGEVDIAVVDCGLGIPRTLKPTHPSLRDDREAVMHAVQKGITRDKAVGQGNGLAGTLAIVKALDGFLSIHSGECRLMLKDGHVSVEKEVSFPGTAIDLVIPTDKPIDVAEALWGFEPLHELEVKYVGTGTDGIRIKLVEESQGFGNRGSARPIRTKILNLLSQFPSDRLTIDFEGVTLMSASFADELIGRLAVQMGVASFFQRVHLVNTSDLIRRSLDAVIAQRISTGE